MKTVIIRYVSFLSLFAAVTFAQVAPTPLHLPAAPTYYDGYSNQVNPIGEVIVGDYNGLGFTVTGGTYPYTLSLTSGQFPPGLAFSSTAEATGVSTAAGTFTFTLTATDSSTPMQTATQTYTVTAGAIPFIVGGSLVGAVVNVPYGGGSSLPPIYARGGIPPYTWKLLQGVIPPGMSLAPTTPAFGQVNLPSEISGTPSAPGTFSFALRVTDSSPTPLTITQTYSLSVINLTPFTDPKSGEPFGIVVGPDKDLWFTQQSQLGTGNLGLPIYGLESISSAGSFNNETKLTNQVPGANGSPVYPAPQSITVGPDGSFWMTDYGDGAIIPAKSLAPGTPIRLLTPSGTPLSPGGIASGGSEGGVWFSAVQGFSPGTGFIGRIDAANPGAPTLYTIPQASSYPTGIVQNPKDGNAIWFMDQYQPAGVEPVLVIGRIPVPANPSSPFQIPAGCQALNAQLGVSIDECVIPGTQGHVLGPPNAPVGPLMQVDSTGTVWFASRDQIGSISADGSKVQLSSVAPPNAGATTFRVTSLTLGSDGAVWYIGNDQNTDSEFIGRVSTSGTNSTVTQFQIPSSTLDPGQSDPQSITTGPDLALWFTDAVSPQTGKVVQVFPSLTLNCSVPSTLYVNAAIPSNAQCSAIGGKGPYTYTYDKTNAPPGVTISASGVISGTPTAPGSFNISVSDSGSPQQQANQVISILPPPTIELSCSFPLGVAGQPYSGSCITLNGDPPYTYTISPSNALSVLGLTGVAITPSGSNSSFGFSVSGTLSAAAHGTVPFTITATDSATPIPNTSAPQQITITITALSVSLSCSPSALAAVGRPFQQQCFGSAGTPPYTFSATGLPSGLSINASTGVISGTATSPAETSVNVVVTDSAGGTATETINFSVANPKLSLQCVFPPSATVGTAYTAACTASGGVGPYSYSIATGTLPAGLALNPTGGSVSGTPTGLGSAFTVQVTDSESPAATALFSENLFVQPAVLTILSTSLPVPNPGLLYAAVPMVYGGAPPYTFAISSGALPAGLQLSPASGVISSVAPGSSGALATGPYSFTIQVKDSAGATATQAYSGTILAPVQAEITSYALPSPSGANGITLGPNGALWFTTLDQAGGNMIGDITTAGAIASVTSANGLTEVNSPELPTGGDITSGPDGNVWIAQRDGGVVGQISTNGAQFTYVPPTPNSSPAEITTGPDGTLWFTEAAVSKIGHVGPGGSVVEFPTPSPGAFPLGIASGPYGLVVFTETLVNKIGYLSTDGKTSGDFTIPTANALPTSIVQGPDKAFWFTEYGGNKIGRMDFGGNFTEFPVSSAPTAITLGPDDALYFTETAGNSIGRITIAGAVTEFGVTDMNSGPTGIATGPDGALWFTEDTASKIGRLSFVVGPTVSCTLPSSPQKAGIQFSGKCSATQGTQPYTFSASGIPGLTIDSTTGVISGTLTTAGTFTLTVVVTDSSTPPLTGQKSYTFTVSPLALGMTCNPPPAYLYTAYSASACSGTNGTPPYQYKLTSGTLPTGLTFNTSTGNITGPATALGPAALGSFPISVQVTDSSTPVMTASMSTTIQVEYGAVTSTGGALFTLSTPPTEVNPGASVTGLTLTPNEPLQATVTGTATLSFTDYTLLANTPKGYVDPAMQFVDSNGNGTGVTYNFTIPPGRSAITLAGFTVGTVAGTIDIAITADGVAQETGVVVVQPATPVIDAGSVQFTNVTSTGFDLEFTGTSATRALDTVTITLNPAPGAQIVGQGTDVPFTIDVSKTMSAWFQSPASFPYGGRFSLTIPLEVSGDISAIASATVQITVAGNPSQPVTGSM